MKSRTVTYTGIITKSRRHVLRVSLEAFYSSTVTVVVSKEMLESTATFSVEAASQVYSQTNEFVYLGGDVNHNEC